MPYENSERISFYYPYYNNFLHITLAISENLVN